MYKEEKSFEFFVSWFEILIHLMWKRMYKFRTEAKTETEQSWS